MTFCTFLKFTFIILSFLSFFFLISNFFDFFYSLYFFFFFFFCALIDFFCFRTKMFLSLFRFQFFLFKKNVWKLFEHHSSLKIRNLKPKKKTKTIPENLSSFSFFSFWMYGLAKFHIIDFCY